MFCMDGAICPRYSSGNKLPRKWLGMAFGMKHYQPSDKLREKCKSGEAYPVLIFSPAQNF